MGRPRVHALPVIGTRFGRWTTTGQFYKGRVPCQCDCGTLSNVYYANLYMGWSRGCGCDRVEQITKRNTTHGRTGTRLYNIWCGAKQRCSSHASGFHAQQYRGIHMFREWRKSFKVFMEWSEANCYAEDLVLDRKNGRLGYNPKNCRWVTRKQNARNCKTNHMVTAFGETRCIAEWADDERCSIRAQLLSARLRLGIDPERAISMPHRWA